MEVEIQVAEEVEVEVEAQVSEQPLELSGDLRWGTGDDASVASAARARDCQVMFLGQ